MNKSFTGARVQCPTCKARTFIQDAPWKRVCVTCYLAQKGTPTNAMPPPAKGIEPEMLRRLLQLCHPDRHGNSEASNTATRYLLALRGAARTGCECRTH
jgi:hypothetical protein